MTAKYEVQPVTRYALKRTVDGRKADLVGTFNTEEEAERFRDSMIDLDAEPCPTED